MTLYIYTKIIFFILQFKSKFKNYCFIFLLFLMENDLEKGWRGKGGSGLDGILYCLVKMLSLAAAPTTDQRGNAM